MEPLRQHYMVATGKGVQPAPDPNPKPNFIKPSEAGTAKDAHPNPMMMKKGR
jgi:hypothetical protein